MADASTVKPSNVQAPVLPKGLEKPNARPGAPFRSENKTIQTKQKTLTQREQLDKVVKHTERISERLSFIERIRRLGSQKERVFVLIVAAAVILYWRGLWTFYDWFFKTSLPDHPVWGAFISIVVGAGVLWGTRRLMITLS
jgi:hypothetical protein